MTIPFHPHEETVPDHEVNALLEVGEPTPSREIAQVCFPLAKDALRTRLPERVEVPSR